MDTLPNFVRGLWENAAIGYAIIFIVAVAVFVFLRGYRLFGMTFIPDNHVGVITKKFAFKHLANGRIVATRGEAGFQAATLAPGIRWGLWPWQYAVRRDRLVTIDAGHVGVVTAIDGVPIPPGRILGKHVESHLCQDAAAFLENGGQRGPQADILPPGVYRINRLLFSVNEEPALDVPANKVALVTTRDGGALASGEIAGPEIPGHSSFQNADAFVAGGGRRGQQEQVLMPGRYYINPLFVDVEFIDMTDVPIGHVGVAISYVGAVGEDQTGADFTHGNIVKRGQRGVWSTPLDPGRYPINSRIMRIEIVPTTNTVLNWITGYKEAHGLDAALASIDVRSKDGFSFPIEVSQIIHIAAKNAPKVIARFGTVPNLVSQVLEPMIDNYFRNAAQSSEFLAFLTNRAQRQKEASDFIRGALGKLDVEAVDTLMGDINPPQALMDTLTQRKIAEEQKTTFATQPTSQIQRQEFEKAKSEADTRGQIVQAGREAEIATLKARAAISLAEGEAGAKKINAEADANVLRVTGEAKGLQTRSIGEAEADVLRRKVEAVGQVNYSVLEVLAHLAASKTPIVPQIAGRERRRADRIARGRAGGHAGGADGQPKSSRVARGAVSPAPAAFATPAPVRSSDCAVAAGDVWPSIPGAFDVPCRNLRARAPVPRGGGRGGVIARFRPRVVEAVPHRRGSHGDPIRLGRVFAANGRCRVPGARSRGRHPAHRRRRGVPRPARQRVCQRGERFRGPSSPSGAKLRDLGIVALEPTAVRAAGGRVDSLRAHRRAGLRPSGRPGNCGVSGVFRDRAGVRGGGARADRQPPAQRRADAGRAVEVDGARAACAPPAPACRRRDVRRHVRISSRRAPRYGGSRRHGQNRQFGHSTCDRPLRGVLVGRLRRHVPPPQERP